MSDPIAFYHRSGARLTGRPRGLSFTWATLLVAGLILVNLAGGSGAAAAEPGAAASAPMVTSGASPATGRTGFSKTGSLLHPRVYHTATLLADGRVLIAGGSTDTATLATAELYDPATGKFTATGSMLHARRYHTATRLLNGQVLIVGGIGQGGNPEKGVLASAELFDPTTGKFRATGSMAHPYSKHTATLLANGNVLVVGGYGVLAELYDTATGKFHATGSMTFLRDNFAATALPDGQVLLAGGWNVFCLALDAPIGCVFYSTRGELYSPTTGKFRASGSMVHFRNDPSLTLLGSGRVLAAGGDGRGSPELVALASAELYDPMTGTFHATGSMAHVRNKPQGTALSDGRVLITGGLNDNDSAIAAAEVYNPATGKFSAAGSMPVARSSHTATLLADGRVLIAGGLGDVVLGSAEIWQP